MLRGCMFSVADGTLMRVFAHSPIIATAARIVFTAGNRSIRLIDGFIITLAATAIANTLNRCVDLEWGNRGYVRLLAHSFIR